LKLPKKIQFNSIQFDSVRGGNIFFLETKEKLPTWIQADPLEKSLFQKLIGVGEPLWNWFRDSEKVAFLF
jgi:hypothetical protein